jgi:serine/threonine protein kinase
LSTSYGSGTIATARYVSTWQRRQTPVGSVGIAKLPEWGCDDSGQWPAQYRDNRSRDSHDPESSFLPVDGTAAVSSDAPFPKSVGAHTEAESRIGRYQILRKIGEGQYATVYRGRDPVLGRSVALKLPRPGVLPVAKMKERFLSEARALARLKHPSIIPVFELGYDQDQCFIAMALVEGQSLEQLQKHERQSIRATKAARMTSPRLSTTCTRTESCIATSNRRTC